MTTFADRLALRDPAVPVLQTEKGPRMLAEFFAAWSGPLLRGDQSIAISIRDPARLLKLLVAGDGHCPGMLLLSASLSPDVVQDLAAKANCRTIVSDRSDIAGALLPETVLVGNHQGRRDHVVETDWIMTTSGTTGLPKMIRHQLGSLSRTVKPWSAGTVPIWGLTYEATRFAGMQVLLQAVLGGGMLVAADPETQLSARVLHFVGSGVTHVSATPTLWRQILMHPASKQLGLRQITLGGEIADQTLLDKLSAQFPDARISHVYASTETGVGFSVIDKREGFPLRYLEEEVNGVRLKVVDGRLWVRAPGPETALMGSEEGIRRDSEGFADTQDRVEFRGERVVFLGRDTGAVNIGGAKVYPENVERIINQMTEVALVRVTAKRNPISGAVLVAQIVPADSVSDPDAFKARVIRHCRTLLPRESVPALVQLGDSLVVNAAGKLTRSG